MNSQHTEPQVIRQETAQVAKCTGSDRIVLNDIGWDSRVYTVNDGEFFFKFPRSPKIQGRYSQEIAALDTAKQIGDVHVPEVLWRDPENRFFGYRGVPGTILDDLVSSLSDGQKTQIGKNVGSFLARFHQQSFPGVRVKTIDDEIAQLFEWYQPAAPVLQQAYTPDDYAAINALVHKTWPERMRQLGRVPALCHGDLHLNNMLLGQDTKLGIIDFGDVAEYDQSKDFIDLGDPVIEAAAISAYGGDEQLQAKIAVRKDTMRIISLTYHIKKHNKERVQHHLELIRRSLKAV